MATRVELKSRFPEIIVKMPPKLEDDQVAIANKIADEARLLAPRLNRVLVYPPYIRTPGWMAASIESHDVPGGGTSVEVGAYWGTFVEYGTEHMRRQPFLRPAALVNEPELLGRVTQSLESL